VIGHTERTRDVLRLDEGVGAANEQHIDLVGAQRSRELPPQCSSTTPWVDGEARSAPKCARAGCSPVHMHPRGLITPMSALTVALSITASHQVNGGSEASPRPPELTTFRESSHRVGGAELRRRGSQLTRV
jgi:hypothetical protein